MAGTGGQGGERLKRSEAATASRTGRSIVVPPSADRKAFVETLPSAPFKVRALRIGYYNHVRRRADDVFILRAREDFSEKWMELADPSAQPRKTGAQAAIQREHDEILGGKVVSRNNPGGGGAQLRANSTPRDQDFDEQFS